MEENKDRVVTNKHPVYNMVIGIAQRIVDANKDIEFFRDQNWTVWVIDANEPNAFVLPVNPQDCYLFGLFGLSSYVRRVSSVVVVGVGVCAHLSLPQD